MSSWLNRFTELAGLKAEAPIPLVRKKEDVEAEKILRETSERAMTSLRKESSKNKFTRDIQSGLYIRSCKGEDGPPVAETIYRMESGRETKVVINSVTDGVGGAAKHQRFIDEDVEFKTEAKLGAEEIQKVFSDYIINQPDVFLGEAVDLCNFFNKAFRNALIQLDKKYSLKRDDVLSPWGHFQTTFSAVVVQEREDYKNVQMIWAGDSPIIVVTPNMVVSSTNCENGNAPLKNCLSTNSVNLKSRTLHIKNKQPLVAIACSDGMTKFTGVNNQLDTIVEGTLANLKISRNSGEFAGNFEKFYYDMGRIDDDTTFSISTLINSSEDLENLSVSGKQKINYDK